MVVSESDKRGSNRERYWVVDCSCGTKNYLVKQSSLLNGDTRSCRCLQRESVAMRMRTDRIKAGQVFGRLTVVVDAPNRDRAGSALWTVDCSCGTKGRVVTQSSLLKGTTRSCGCLARELSKGRSQLRGRNVSVDRRVGRVVNDYRWSARDRGYTWNLLDEEASQLLRSSCVFCGSPYSRTLGEGTPTECKINGIDRWDNAKGYESGNAVSCCTTCNYAKGKLSGGEYLAHVKKIYEHCRVVLDSQKALL